MSNPALITFLLDKSSSMLSCKAATIEGFNGYLATLQEEKDAEIDFTFLQFDTVSIDKVCVAIPVRDAVPLTPETYLPRGGTPLIDACVKTIRAVEAALPKRPGNPRVVICIQTDGEENSSTEYNWSFLKELVAQKTAEGWEFNFMGVGIDAYQQAAKMGVSAANTMSYNVADAGMTKDAFVASAANAASFSAGRAAGTSYSAQQRSAAGDAYAGGAAYVANHVPAPQPGVIQTATAPAPVAALDLSQPLQPGVTPFDLAKQTLAPKRRAVADITL